MPVGFDVRIEDDPELPTDSFSFHQAKVPAVTLTTGREVDPAVGGATQPPDREETERLARFATLLVRKLDALEQRPVHVEFALEPEKPALAKQSAYTGTIPDYTAEVEGLLLEGVMEGGPAAAAGLAAGDVIVEVAGKEINDIYGYRDVLETLEVGHPVRFVFIRDGERREASVVPTARP